MTVKNELRNLAAAAKQDYWRDRLAAEVSFLEQLAATSDEIAQAIEAAAREITKRVQAEGAVTGDTVRQLEETLADLSTACKAYELVCVGHAHIDMNWMWGFHETVSVTIDTFRTVLELLERYPKFHFSQSQAAVYQIVERYAPQLVDPIRAQIAAGRWEVTASQWVESDMNLPSGESLTRQMLYSRRYLLDRYGVPEEAFELVFLPDTFGHNANTPDILSSAGVRYLYHCRGAVGPHLSRWEAPSGRTVVVYREPRWYNTDVTSKVAEFLPKFAEESGVRQALCLYGVGDHGGGPTVRDIERLADMAGWPLFPTVTFGSLRGYFERVVASGVEPEIYRGERNMIFTGCYSSQSRIKMANRWAEKLLYEAELDTALARVRAGLQKGDELVARNLRDAWTRTLFSNFHDILPGSGVELTREYAMGTFQESTAAALAAQSEALRRLSAADSPESAAAAHEADEAASPSPSRSEGAGVGFGTERYELPATERGRGRKRVYHLYNSLQWERETAAQITVWDWPGEARSIECIDAEGNRLEHQIIEAGKDEYWGHNFLRLWVRVHAPAFGYAVVEVREAKEPAPHELFFPGGIDRWLVEEPAATVLENSHIRAAFDPVTMRLRSLYDKLTKTELLSGGEPPQEETDRDLAADRLAGGTSESGGLFRLVEEEAGGMTAWIVGRYQAVRPLERVSRIRERVVGPTLAQQWLAYDLEIPHRVDEPVSRMTIRVSLERDSSRLRYEVDCHWLEAGVAGKGIPQLQYALGLSRPGHLVRCDIPFGVIDRSPAALDIPANSFAAVIPESGNWPVAQITADSRQAFRFDGNALSLTLLRSSVDPDPYPELGRHQFSFTVGLLSPKAVSRPSLSMREALEVRHPLRAVSIGGGPAAAAGTERTVGGSPGRRTAGPGGSSTDGSLLSVESTGCVVASVKLPEPPGWLPELDPGQVQGALAESRIIVRLYEVNATADKVEISLPQGPPITAARFLDLHERPVAGATPSVVAGAAQFAVPPREVVTVELTIEKERR